MPDILLHLLPHIAAALLYAGLGYHFWHTRWNDTGKPLDPLPMQPWERCAIAVALLLQGAGLAGTVLQQQPRFSFSDSVADAVADRSHLLAGELPVAHGRHAAHGASLGGPGPPPPVAFPQTHEIAMRKPWVFKMHFLVAMLAYSLFTLSALHAVFMGFIEHKLHRKTLSRHQASLPSILSMESLLFRMIGIAFLLLTLTLISGLAFSGADFGKAFVLDPGTVFAFASWVIFAALLFGQANYGWRGKNRAALDAGGISPAHSRLHR